MTAITPFIDLLRPLTADTGTRQANGGTADRSRNPEPQIDALITPSGNTSAGAAASPDAGELLEAVREAAFEEGQQAARIAMEAEVRADWRTAQEGVREELRRIIYEVGTARQRLWENQEAEMLALVMEIARQVIKTEVKLNPDIVLHTIGNAVRRLTAKENVRLRISLADSAHVREMRDDLLAVIGGIHDVEIIDDRRIGAGGCVIETSSGTIDAKIETQITEIERALDINGHE